MGIITIKNLIVQAHHGVLEQERRVGNAFRINLSVEVLRMDAMITDDLADTVNYAEIVEIIRQSMSHSRNLLEAAAGDIIKALEERYSQELSSGIITIEKLAPPIPAEMESVGVTIEF